jgi:methylase of polypeptide subunit release factors
MSRRQALASGEDGLDAIRRIVAATPRYLNPGGRCFWNTAMTRAFGAGTDGAAGFEDCRSTGIWEESCA